MAHIVIIGNGISGITTARHVRKFSDHEITVISGESKYFYSRTALMWQFMGHMRLKDMTPYESWFWSKNRINLVHDWVENIDFDKRSLKLREQGDLKYDKLVLAVGSKFNKFGWPGEDLEGVQGMVNLQDIELMEQNTKDIKHGVIVGGGLIGVEMAECLVSRGISVTMLVRENEYWGNVLPKEEARLVGRHIAKHHVNLRLKTELKEIQPDEFGKVRAVITSDHDEIACQFVGLTAGVSPNISLVHNTPLNTDRGILVNHYFETNMEGVYAIGDCAQFKEPLVGRSAIEQVWYTGRIHGETLAQTLTGNRSEYCPGPWFNSAKFFDIEYQTYGTVDPKRLKEFGSFYWVSDDVKKCLRLVYHKDNLQLIGLNAIGIRLRHELCDRWLKEKRDIVHFMENLKAVNFDGEFANRNYRQIQAKFNHEFSANQIELKPKKKLIKQIFNRG